MGLLPVWVGVIEQTASGPLGEREINDLLESRGADCGVFGLEGLGTHRGAQALAVEAGQAASSRWRVSPRSARAWSAAPCGRADRPGWLRRGRPGLTQVQGGIMTATIENVHVEVRSTLKRSGNYVWLMPHDPLHAPIPGSPGGHRPAPQGGRETPSQVQPPVRLGENVRIAAKSGHSLPFLAARV